MTGTPAEPGEPSDGGGGGGRHAVSASATSSTGTRKNAALERRRERGARLRSRRGRRRISSGITKKIGATGPRIEREHTLRGSLPCAGDDRRRRLPGRKRTEC